MRKRWFFIREAKNSTIVRSAPSVRCGFLMLHSVLLKMECFWIKKTRNAARRYPAAGEE
jgi:hypothetical protein